MLSDVEESKKVATLKQSLPNLERYNPIIPPKNTMK